MTRVKGWEEKLFKFVDDTLGEPFEWGVRDCNIYALECQDIIYETEFANQARKKFNDKKSALAFQRKRGNLKEGLKGEGYVDIKKNFWQTGDVILVESDGFLAGHVCMGNKAVGVVEGHGVILFPIQDLPDIYITLRAPLGVS
jgi:hypothetical protein